MLFRNKSQNTVIRLTVGSRERHPAVPPVQRVNSPRGMLFDLQAAQIPVVLRQMLCPGIDTECGKLLLAVCPGAAKQFTNDTARLRARSSDTASGLANSCFSG